MDTPLLPPHQPAAQKDSDSKGARLMGGGGGGLHGCGGIPFIHSFIQASRLEQLANMQGKI